MPEEPNRIESAFGGPLAGAEWNPANGWYVRFLETPGYEHAISITAPWRGADDTLHTPLDDARRLVAAVQAAITWADARIRGEAPRAGSLGDRLRQLRTRARLEVDELARCLGREIGQVRAVESDEVVPSAVEIGMWAAVCCAEPETAEALEDMAAGLRRKP
ncbi:helix-turn-helix domain-containing protein [Cryptosporangium minutisporangium]|uniref:XRE family transcriptional regulator n=1 Tax=Cryptosporangium minutisporangium TaxID=113569 RepID=A0ABP6SYU9_9ACTN